MTDVLIPVSGGLDSAAVLVLNRHRRRKAVFFDYGQPHIIEKESAFAVCTHEGVDLQVVFVPQIPRVNDVVFAGRNGVFASYAASLCQQAGIPSFAVGCNRDDWNRFPDCRPLFWDNLSRAFESAYGVSIETPLIHHLKIDVVTYLRKHHFPIGITWSCYAPTPEGNPCGECLACKTRIRAENFS
jgi:7-cyano-7-deazaguanine synthase